MTPADLSFGESNDKEIKDIININTHDIETIDILTTRTYQMYQMVVDEAELWIDECTCHLCMLETVGDRTICIECSKLGLLRHFDCVEKLNAHRESTYVPT